MERRLLSRFVPGGLASLLLAAVVGVLSAGPSFGQDAPFIRGDSNLDGEVNITDPVLLLRMLFLGEAPRGCDDALDLDDDGHLSLEDCILGLQFLFLDGSQPPMPFGECGRDPTADELGCVLHPLCEVDGDPCIPQESVSALLGGLVAPSFSLCIPAGILDLPLDPLSISLCPEDEAQACGLTGTPGCSLDITSISASMDLPAKRVALIFEGRMDDLPVRVTDSIFNSSTTCVTSLHGEDPALPFHLEAVISLETVEISPGVVEIIGTSGGQVESVDMALSATGGLLCSLFEAGQGALLELIVTPLESILESIAGPLGDQLVGLRLCTGPDSQ